MGGGLLGTASAGVSACALSGGLLVRAGIGLRRIVAAGHLVGVFRMTTRVVALRVRLADGGAFRRRGVLGAGERMALARALAPCIRGELVRLRALRGVGAHNQR